MRRAAALVAVVAFAASSTGCSGDGAANEAPTASRAEVVKDLVDDVIVPGYESAAASAMTFGQQATRLCTSPSEEALRDARLALVDAWS